MSIALFTGTLVNKLTTSKLTRVSFSLKGGVVDLPGEICRVLDVGFCLATEGSEDLG